jgi:hypothetical protein
MLVGLFFFVRCFYFVSSKKTEQGLQYKTNTTNEMGALIMMVLTQGIVLLQYIFL